jgi:hypothetical protein
VLIALFHPDYNRRLWNFTKSADTLAGRSRAFTAGGELHPALRTSLRYRATTQKPSPKSPLEICDSTIYFMRFTVGFFRLGVFSAGD